MADEAPAPEQPAVVETAPVVEAPAPSPVVETAPPAEVAPVEPPVEKPVDPPAAPKDLLKEATAEEAPPADKPEEKPADKPADQKPEEKPADAKPEEKAQDAPAEEKPPETQTLAPLAEYKYEVPEELTFTDDRREKFHGAVENARNGDMQSLVDLHLEAMREHHQRMEQNQRDQWNQTLDGWRQQVEDDPEIGGTKFQGVSRRVAQMRDRFISKHERGTPEWIADRDEFNHMLDSTGVGNHPVLWRVFDRLARALGEPVAPTITDPKPAPQGKRGSDVMYDNPRSPRSNGPN